jgi:hypothetical protein
MMHPYLEREPSGLQEHDRLAVESRQSDGRLEDVAGREVNGDNVVLADAVQTIVGPEPHTPWSVEVK